MNEDEVAGYMTEVNLDLENEIIFGKSDELNDEILLLQKSHKDSKSELNNMFKNQIKNEIPADKQEVFENDLLKTMTDIEENNKLERSAAQEKLQAYHKNNLKFLLDQLDSSISYDEIENIKAKENLDYLMEMRNIIKTSNELEISDLETAYKSLIKKYGINSDDIINEFNLQLSELSAANDLAKQRQLNKIKEQVRMKRLNKIRNLESKHFEKLQKNQGYNDQVTSYLNYEQEEQLNSIVDQQQQEQQELESKLNKMENEEINKLQNGMLLKKIKFFEKF
jgi:hypothetical protein